MKWGYRRMQSEVSVLRADLVRNGDVRALCRLTAIALGAMPVFMFAIADAAAAERSAEAGQEKYVLCASCHGGDGKSAVMPQYPKIAGQNVEYTIGALQSYRDGRRRGTFAALMTEAAKQLSDQDIAELASYIATLDSSK